MATICNQFAIHFPIINSKGCSEISSDRDDFLLLKCWDCINSEHGEDDFDSKYQSIQSPFTERMVSINPAEKTVFLIDYTLKLTIPTKFLTDKALEFWEGRKNVANWSSAISCIAACALLLVMKPATALIATYMPILGVVFAVTSAFLVVFGFAFAASNYIFKVNAEKELQSWEQIQEQLLLLATFPEKIAKIRTSLFEAYCDGKEVIDDQKSLLVGHYLTPQEKSILLEKGIESAFPLLSNEERHLKFCQKSISDLSKTLSANDYKRPIWNYVFPEFTFTPLT